MDLIQTSYASLPRDCLFSIFSLLDVKDLSLAKRVCSIWEDLGKHPQLLAKVCRTFTLISQSTEIESCIAESKERFRVYESLPKNLLKILTTPCPRVTNKLIFETHFLIYIPFQKENQFNENFFAGHCRKIIEIDETKSKAISRVFNQSQVKRAYWILLARNPFQLAGTFWHCQEAQKKVEGYREATLSYELPTAQEALQFVYGYSSLLNSQPMYRVFCKSSVEKIHPVFNVQFGRIEINARRCHVDDRLSHCILGVHKLASLPCQQIDKFALKPEEGSYFDTLPDEIRKCILNWIPEDQYLDCSLVSKHFFDSKWGDYLKGTCLLLPGSKHSQVASYVHHFQSFLLEIFKSEFEYECKKKFTHPKACVNTNNEPKSVFGKIAAFKVCSPAIKKSALKYHEYFISELKVTREYRLRHGSLADIAVRLLIDMHWYPSEMPELFIDALGNKCVLDETCEMWLEQSTTSFAFSHMIEALKYALSVRRSKTVVDNILCRIEFTQENLVNYYKRYYHYRKKNNLINFCLAHNLPLALLIDKIDYTTPDDLYQAIACKLPFELLVKISDKKGSKDNLVRSLQGLENQPTDFWKELLNLALEMHYTEDYILFVMENLPEISFEQLEKARKQAYSSAVLKSMQAKPPSEKCVIS